MESILNRELIRLGVSEKDRRSLKQYLDLIKQKDKKTYQHSIRVALLGIKVAEFLKLDPKPLLYAGLLHDLGKIEIESELLRRKDRFTEEDIKKWKCIL